MECSLVVLLSAQCALPGTPGRCPDRVFSGHRLRNFHVLVPVGDMIILPFEKSILFLPFMSFYLHADLFNIYFGRG